MTTITINRAVVEQALEALEADCGGRCNAEYNPCWQREVAETLRAALARQAEPVAVDAAYQRWLEDTHAPALRRMDSQGAFAAGWQAALAQQAEPVQRSQDWHAGVLEGHLRERERWLAQQAEPVAVAERERIAAQWDGCVTHRLDTFGPVDIGASIRAGELVGPAQQAEPVEPVAWVHTDACNPKVRFLEWTQQPKGYLGDWIKTPLCNCAQPRQTDPQIEDRLARHGIPKP
jgi:hypothetical protein